MQRQVSYIIILLVLVALAGSSCATQRRCSRKFPPHSDTIKIIHVRDSIVLRDTTVYIKVPGEADADSIVIPCPEIINYIADTARAETSLAKAKAWWQYPMVRIELTQKDTTIEIRLKDALKEAHHWRSEYEKITKVPAPVRYIPKIYKYSMMFSVVLILTAILRIVSKFIKPRVK